MSKNKGFDIEAEVTFKSFDDLKVGVEIDANPIIGIKAKMLITHKEFDNRFGETYFEYRARLMAAQQPIERTGETRRSS